MRYRVVWTVTEVEEDWIDAASEDEARMAWLNGGTDGELFFIEDEQGNQTIYN